MFETKPRQDDPPAVRSQDLWRSWWMAREANVVRAAWVVT